MGYVSGDEVEAAFDHLEVDYIYDLISNKLKW